MIANSYEREVIKNYFYKNGGFSGFVDGEPRLYNSLAQAKYRGFGKEDEVDGKAPGGMQTVLYNIMKFRKVPKADAPMGFIESYAVHLVTLTANGVQLTKREENHLNDFVSYYGFSDLNEMEGFIKPSVFPRYTLSDILLTYSIYSYFFENKKEDLVKGFVNKLKLKDIYEVFDPEPLEKTVEYMKKHLLPNIEEVEDSSIIITDMIIEIPKSKKIMWKDLVITCLVGLKYRGLYHPQLQLGAYLKYKMQGNIINLPAPLIAVDDIYRRRYGLDNFLDFWGIEPNTFIEVTTKKGYTIYPFYNLNGQYAPKEGPGRTHKLYNIWFADDTFVVTDAKVMEHVYDKIPIITFTDNYQSKLVNPGYRLPCVAMKGIMTPIVETLTINHPRDGYFHNLTAYNLGIN